MEYREPCLYTHNQVIKIIQSNNISDVCDMLVGVAYNDPDPKYAYKTVLQCLNHKDLSVVGLSIICIAHIARIHGSVPIQETINIFEQLITGPLGNNKEIRGRIGSAVGELSIYQQEIYQDLISKFPEYFKSLGFE